MTAEKKATIALMVGCIDRTARELTEKLKTKAIDVRWNWNDDNARGAHVPKACELVLIMADAVNHQLADYARVKAQEAGVKFMRVSRRWVTLEQQLSIAGWETRVPSSGIAEQVNALRAQGVGAVEVPSGTAVFPSRVASVRVVPNPPQDVEPPAPEAHPLADHLSWDEAADELRIDAETVRRKARALGIEPKDRDGAEVISLEDALTIDADTAPEMDSEVDDSVVPTGPDGTYRTEEAAAYVGCAGGTLVRRVHSGHVLAETRDGERGFLFAKSALDDWKTRRAGVPLMRRRLGPLGGKNPVANPVASLPAPELERSQPEVRERAPDSPPVANAAPAGEQVQRAPTLAEAVAVIRATAVAMGCRTVRVNVNAVEFLAD